MCLKQAIYDLNWCHTAFVVEMKKLEKILEEKQKKKLE